jgi:hypothetical protein
MPFFITRIELHDAGERDYNRLHAAMLDEGFSRQIEGENGKTYHLPTAEYHRQGDDLTAKDVLEEAKRAARATNCDYGLIVTQAARSTWSGLPEA